MRCVRVFFSVQKCTLEVVLARIKKNTENKKSQISLL